MRKQMLELLSQLDAEIPLEVKLGDSLEIGDVLARLEESGDAFIQEQAKTLRRLLRSSQEAGRVSVRRKRLSLSPISDPKPQLI